MDDLFIVMVIAYFVLGPIITRILRGAKGQAPPQRQRHTRGQPVPRQQLPDGRTATTARRTSSESGQDATDLLPADLWQILTGQVPTKQDDADQEAAAPEPEVKPQRRVSVEERRKAAERKRAERIAEAERERSERVAGVTSRRSEPSTEDEQVRQLMRRRERSQATRRRYDHSVPQSVSLETEPAPERTRHAAFHDKLDRLPRPPQIRGPAHVDLGLDSESSLRRAILLQEVLGRPKGLD